MGASMKFNFLILISGVFTSLFCGCQTTNLALKVNDTDFSKGRLGHIQTIELADVVKFHGHRCDGLIVGWLGLNEGLKVLYPDGIFDRTNTRIVSKPSPCLTDVAIYLTGARFQFNTFYVNKELPGLFIAQRIDIGKTVLVSLKKGVKPEKIDQLGQLAEEGILDPCELDTLKAIEDNFSAYLLKTPVSEMFEVKEISNFNWNPTLRADFIKTDILNKNQPPCNYKPQLPATLSPKDFHKKLKHSRNGILIDVRTPEEFTEAHINNAINLDYLADSFGLMVNELDRNAVYFLYCRSGNRTKGASETMTALGFQHIYILDGGILSWEEANKKLVH